MKKSTIALVMLMFCWAGVSHAALTASKPPVEGGILPPFELAAPEDFAARRYLGLSESGRFTISQIEAKVVIVQLFSMY
jgi:hypothetical protein